MLFLWHIPLDNMKVNLVYYKNQINPFRKCYPFFIPMFSQYSEAIVAKFIEHSEVKKGKHIYKIVHVSRVVLKIIFC